MCRRVAWLSTLLYAGQVPLILPAVSIYDSSCLNPLNDNFDINGVCLEFGHYLRYAISYCDRFENAFVRKFVAVEICVQ